MEQQVAITKAVDEKLPENLKVIIYGETKLTKTDEQVSAIRSYIRARVLKQYGVTSMNNSLVSQLPLGFNENNVQTKLRLPKVQVDATGVFNEKPEDYYRRCLTTIRQWFQNAMYNSGISAEVINTLD